MPSIFKHFDSLKSLCIRWCRSPL